MKPENRPGSTPSLVRRYTTLSSVLHVLQTRSLTLVSPMTWDDRNDAFFMAQYRHRKHFASVLALCFAEASETYHHWKVFAQSGDGVCIEFFKERLTADVVRMPGIRLGKVRYMRLADFRKQTVRDDSLPFIKRYPFRHEREFRIVAGLSDNLQTAPVLIELASISRVVLSPWMPKAVAKAVKQTILSIPDCRRMNVYRTTLVDNEAWQKCIMKSSSVSQRVTTE